MKFNKSSWASGKSKMLSSMEGQEDYEKIKADLYIKVIGVEANEKILSKLIYTQIEDIAMVYGLQVQVWEGGTASILFSEKLLQKFGITKQQLHQDAMSNSVRKLPATIQKIEDVIGDIAERELMHPDPSKSEMYVISNIQNLAGAAVLFYPDMMNAISREVGGDYFVLPSSIHDMIIVADDGKRSVDELRAVVKEMNSNLEPVDVLSDQVYHYDAAHQIFEMGSVYAWKKENEIKFWENRKSVAVS